ncbi:transporter substrate-binding domain-containing protein [Aminobacter carboxidus]|uniref:Transporter substrate-binding domain-containing protein n=1 Tax=Aminobacter carboxidus TaxID=376165 RepID=A0ABR9GPR2_9HYPH|nr:transporter substrate-binding domain-containing protein [Aminobacter carboxidus]MBE1205660.1 transporter substrate-binding domain-containing protein [Aminobacter carboxidus]
MKFVWIAEPPFNYLEDGRLSGSDVELARYMFAGIGETFEPVETSFSELLPGLADGRWDVTTGMFATRERAERTFFTLPIWALRDGLLVRESSGDRIAGYRSLAALGGKLAVLAGQVQEHTALGLGSRADNIVIFQDYDDAAQAVADGTVDAYASVEVAHREHISRHSGTGLACVTVRTCERVPASGAFACRSPEIRERLDGVLGGFLGTPAHAALLAPFGLTPESWP